MERPEHTLSTAIMGEVPDLDPSAWLTLGLPMGVAVLAALFIIARQR